MPDEHKNLEAALLAVQAEAPAVQKTKINPAFRSKYVSLDVLMETVMPILNKHGLIWLTFPCAVDGVPSLEYQVIHAVSGGAMTRTMPLQLAKNDPQGQGSAITYARRYSLMAVLGLVADEDDDGNKASSEQKRSQPTAQNGAEVATADDVTSLIEAAKGLSGDQIKLALAACGIEGVKNWGQVPRAKTAQLAKTLAGTERT